MNQEQTTFLITAIKDALNTSQQKQYTIALNHLEERFNSVEQYDASPDDFIVECVESFYEGNAESEFPDERYKGLNLEEIMASINDIARDFKITLCDILKKNPDTDLVNTTGDTWKEAVKLIIGQLIAAYTGIPDQMTIIMFSAAVVYCISHTITNICV
ncbi:hypothetical protein HNP38_002379 [Chryseobacterium defluvii]|uniref:Uncharacterized protein n=1 Tax=Chryseobacterium defluvii TaxID=160396 RepID=A0A840KES2_9FLAO|nr:hypothetical protein [Chryseobacterium defluvii]MBB4807075.1 hypothetical protein [Chryseobacterium defluvii]